MENEYGFVPGEQVINAEILKSVPVVGLVDAPSSGKGTIAEILKKQV